VSPREEAVKTIGGGSSVASRRWRSAVNVFLNIYRIATESIFQITHKFYKEVENLQK